MEREMVSSISPFFHEQGKDVRWWGGGLQNKVRQNRRREFASAFPSSFRSYVPVLVKLDVAYVAWESILMESL